jgi:hypothetical protein
MMKYNRNPVLIALLSLLLTACAAALKGYPPSAPDPLSQKESGTLLEAAAISRFRQAPTVDKRNEILLARLLAIDRNFQAFEQDLYQQGLQLGIGADWLVLALSGATATVGGEGTKSVLGAVTTAVTGAKASFDKRAFMEKSLIAIIAKMNADRASVEADIRTGMRLNLSSYPIEDGLSHLRKYYEAGTLPSALNSIVVSAATEKTAAEAKIEKLQIASYRKDNAGDLLYNFWKPDGASIDTGNQDALRRWMGSNGFNIGPGSITMFLRSDVATSARERALEALAPVELEGE